MALPKTLNKSWVAWMPVAAPRMAPTVTGRDMADLVTQHGGEFGLGIEIGENPAGDVDVSARQGEGVDLRAVEHGEVKREMRAVALRRQFLADPLDVGLEFRVGIDAVLLLDLAVVAVPELNLLGLGHEHHIRCARDGIRGAAGNKARRGGGQKKGGQKVSAATVAHGLNSA